MENILVNIDSRFRDKTKYPTSTSFTILQDDKIKNAKYIRVSGVEMPNTYYYFTEARGNVAFRIIMEQGNPGETFDIVLREGNYTSDLLLNFIQSEYLDEINANTETLPTQIQRYNFQITFDEINSKVLISNYTNTRIISGSPVAVGGANFSLDFSRNIPTPYPTLGQSFGFTETFYSGTNYYYGENILNVGIDTYCYLRVNDYGIIYNHVRDKRLLAKIIIDNYKNFVIYDNKNFISKDYVFVQPVNIDKFDVELLDMFGNQIDLLGQEISITLEIGVIENVDLYDTMNQGNFTTLP